MPGIRGTYGLYFSVPCRRMVYARPPASPPQTEPRMEVIPTHPRCAEHVDALRDQVNSALKQLVPETTPPELYDPVRYVLEGGGKRLRPVLLLLAAEAFGATTSAALPAAQAVEVFHNFTLVHDDIMDRAQERRGRPTVHVQWDTSTAILSGDYLLALSYDLLAQVPTTQLARLIRTYHQMVRRLCEGQTLDTVFENREGVSVEAYLDMIDGKTGALLRACLELGGLIGGAGERHLEALAAAGTHLGRAFQIQDDLLDLVADDDRWGKVIGGDLMEGKKTYLLLRALEQAEGPMYDWFARIVRDNGLPADLVPEARDRMASLGILQEARAAVEEHTLAAHGQLSALPGSQALDTLRWLIAKMRARVH